MKVIPVKTASSYEIRVGSGLIETVGDAVESLGRAESVMLVSDDTVYGLYGKTVQKSLEQKGFQTSVFVFPHGEEQKNLATYGALLNALAENRLSRSDVLVALGGGVVGDMAGFAAATYLRGIRFVQVPTTLLAAVDSSVGGKTAVDLSEGKNLVGAFHQPSLVLSDIDTLQTLPREQYLSGAAETLKYGMIGSAKLFDRWTETPISEIYEETIEAAVRMKRDLVEQDEFDDGVRMLLNFGHTFGHAIEACSHYSILHGHAVAIGMATITRSAIRMGLCSEEAGEALENTLKRYGLPTEASYTAEELLPHLLLDKKSRGNVQKLIVPKKIGECVILAVEKEKLPDWLAAGGIR